MMNKKSPKIRPLGDRVVVEPQESETKTEGGILIPETAGQEKPSEGTIVALSKGRYVDGKMVPLPLEIGEKVLFNKYSGTNIKLGGKEYLVMREEDIMGVIE